ncbi:hypothetical protein Ahy_A07g033324 isoform H [Arachis hypogaea]|uniref:Secreted protein n=1 Tax=Arachis hypogaea TaxID=3818 RepID=A0A445C923_ARAHY|nr:hypothetical protein Ahy_A07g033324 isoform H [Arachis hypogaea]
MFSLTPLSSPMCHFFLGLALTVLESSSSHSVYSPSQAQTPLFWARFAGGRTTRNPVTRLRVRSMFNHLLLSIQSSGDDV